MSVNRIAALSNRHPCFSGDANHNLGRIHLPVSPRCNIQCRFCRRSFNKSEDRPGVSAALLTPEEAVSYTRRALELCPRITVAGIAGPGDTLATPHALETFTLIHRAFPALIKCLSTNGLLLEQYVDDLAAAGVQTVTVTMNALDPKILAQICAGVTLGEAAYTGEEGAEILIEAQKRGVKKAAERGLAVKINFVLIPGLNSGEAARIARTARDLGAAVINIIPLIPQFEMADRKAPDCGELAAAREAAEAFVPVFRHCRHCRADACGIPGKSDVSNLLYAGKTNIEENFSHG